MGVNAEEDVRLLVASHWHDDHVRGLTETLKATAKARLVLSDAIRRKEWLALARLIEPKLMMRSSGLRELSGVIEHLRTTGATSTRGVANKRLWKPSGSPRVEVWSLSPSEREIELANEQVAAMLANPNLVNERVPDASPNHASVVLWLTVQGTVVLLGADLEESGNPALGWSAILRSAERPTERAEVFKVSHHGSATGDHADVWTEMLVPEPIAVLTPFVHGRQAIPTSADISRIRSRSGTAFITTTAEPATTAFDPDVDAILRTSTVAVSDSETAAGHIRLRKRLDETSWRVQLFDGAVPL